MYFLVVEGFLAGNGVTAVHVECGRSMGAEGVAGRVGTGRKESPLTHKHSAGLLRCRILRFD